MLFLLSLYCFAGSMIIGGVEFDDVIKEYDPTVDPEGAAVFIVGKNGGLVSTGRLVSKGQAPQPEISVASTNSVDFTSLKIPTQQWDGRQISIQQIEIFGTHQCPYCKYADRLAKNKFGKQNVKSYKIEDNPLYRQKSQDILNAAGRSDFNTVPRISVIDSNNMRWFIGGFSDLQNFVKTNENTSIAPQTAGDIQASASTNFAELPLSTALYRQGMLVEPIQIEIFGADYCPPCRASKALADKVFGDDKVKFYDIKKSGQYLNISNNILRTVRWGDTRMPRISVIHNGSNGPKRLFLGGYGQLQNFISSIGKTNAMVRPQTQNNWPKNNSQRVQNNLSQNQKAQPDRLNAFAPIRQVADFFGKRYRGQY